MNANDLITQVHSEEDENGHIDPHHDADPPPSAWQRFLSCLSCKACKEPQKPLAHSKPSIPLQPRMPPPSSAPVVQSKPVSLPPIPPVSPPPAPAPTMNGGAPPSKYLLPPLPKEEVLSNKKTLVLDLDETLVHSSFKPIPNADFVLSIDLEGVIHRVSDTDAHSGVQGGDGQPVQERLMGCGECWRSLPRGVLCCVVRYVRKRPGVDQFLRYCAEKFEVVVFTASLAKVSRRTPSPPLHSRPSTPSRRRLPTPPHCASSSLSPVSLHCCPSSAPPLSTPIRCWTSWTASTRCACVCSARPACSTTATT